MRRVDEAPLVREASESLLAKSLPALARFQFLSTAVDVPAAAGAYVLAIELVRPATVRIGSTPAGILGPGRYLYCGSAKGPGGLKARLARHMRRRKSVRWHVDQLTTRGRVLGAWIAPGRSECDLVSALAALKCPVPGFGSTDCTRCVSHLLAWPQT